MKARQAPRRTGRDAPSRRQHASISPCPSDAAPSCAKGKPVGTLDKGYSRTRLAFGGRSRALKVYRIVYALTHGRLARDQGGAALAENTIILGLMVALTLGAMKFAGPKMVDEWQNFLVAVHCADPRQDSNGDERHDPGPPARGHPPDRR
jgi:hypothetical protein